MKVVAPASQRSLRGLALLESQAEVSWLDSDGCAVARDPLVCSAQMLSEPGAAGLLTRRMDTGLATLLLPRFQAGDLTALLGSSQPIRIGPGEAADTQWHDGTSYPVPARAAIVTAIGHGRWLAHRDLCAGLAWRRTAAQGTVVLCTAACCQRHPSIPQDAQRALLLRLVEAVRDQTRLPPQVASVTTSERAVDVDAFLATEGPDAAALLLARCIDPAGDAAAVIAQYLHCEVAADRLAQLQSRCPTGDAAGFIPALRRHGWGAHVRASLQAIAAKGDP